MKHHRPAGLLILLLASAGALADVYHFVEADVAHFSDRADDPRGVLVLREAAAGNTIGIGSRPTLQPRLRSRSTPSIDAAIAAAAVTHGVEAALLHAVVQVESAYDVRAVSAKGAGGLMQLMPATARRHGVLDVFDVRANVDGGARHLRRLLDSHGGDLRLALAAYNAGDAAVRRHGGVPPFAETRRYVPAVLERLAALRAAG